MKNFEFKNSQINLRAQYANFSLLAKGYQNACAFDLGEMVKVLTLSYITPIPP